MVKNVTIQFDKTLQTEGELHLKGMPNEVFLKHASAYRKVVYPSMASHKKGSVQMDALLRGIEEGLGERYYGVFDDLLRYAYLGEEKLFAKEDEKYGFYNALSERLGLSVQMMDVVFIKVLVELYGGK